MSFPLYVTNAHSILVPLAQTRGKSSKKKKTNTLGLEAITWVILTLHWQYYTHTDEFYSDNALLVEVFASIKMFINTMYKISWNKLERCPSHGMNIITDYY